ncbi:predicted protein [Botrytis cinerea T4]|uniref:Uncharacterized protein n=1 Tax=Botryotinia fuckeliana (strain T4) TaxID=999810 RepID=G2XXJ8_BOTF4|nr:predicted protein [Botrytis cinerea T4]
MSMLLRLYCKGFSAVKKEQEPKQSRDAMLLSLEALGSKMILSPENLLDYFSAASDVKCRIFLEKHEKAPLFIL